MDSVLKTLQRILEMSFSNRRVERVKTPTVLQMENTECAAASLSMILQYHGKYVPLAQLRKICGVSRDGSDAANLVQAAISLGLKAKGFKKGVDALRKLKPPAILFWEFNHFLVFEGFIGKNVALNDPALGARIVTEEEFDTSYTGITITFEPDKGFIKGGSAPSVWPIVFKRSFSESRGTLFVIVCGLLLVLPQLIMPVYAQIYIDEVINNGINSWLKPMLIAMAITIGIQAILQNLQLNGTRALEKRLTRRFAIDFEHHALSLPDNFYSQRYASDIANRMEHNQEIAEFIGEKLLPTISGIVLLTFYLILTFLYSPVLGLLILTTTGLNALVVQANIQLQKDSNLKLLKDEAKSASVVVNTMQDIETIKSAAIENDVFRRFSGYQARLLNTIQEIQLRNAKIRVVPDLLTTFNEIAVLLVGFFLVIKGDLTLGMLLAAQTIAFSLKGQIEKVIAFVQSLPEFEAGILRLEDILEQPCDPLLDNKLRRKNDFPSSRLSGKIELVDIKFGFSPIQEPLFKGLNLTIAAGERVAIVGGSGSGKSTIAKLIAGILQPDSGDIYYDDYEIGKIPREVMCGSLAMVQQNISLYGCSIRENLTLWNPNISQSNLIRACEDANILEVVENLSRGFDTQLSEGGKNLSGGQRQRLEMARSLSRNPSILVLDEATSALDAETEWKVIERLRLRGCTQIIIAHRLSTIRDADRILVMHKGKIIQTGTHEELLKEIDQPYAELLKEKTD